MKLKIPCFVVCVKKALHPICTHISGRPTLVLIIIVMATDYLCKWGSNQGFQNHFSQDFSKWGSLVLNKNGN